MNKTEINKNTLAAFTFFVALGALTGFVLMMVDPFGTKLGMDGFLQNLQQSLPCAEALTKTLIPWGIALLCVIGLPHVLAGTLLLFRRHCSPYVCMFCAFLLMLCCCLEYYLFGFYIHIIVFFVLGIIEMISAKLYRNRFK